MKNHPCPTSQPTNKYRQYLWFSRAFFEEAKNIGNEWFNLDFIVFGFTMQSRHDTSLLFVYGLLRRGCNHPMASYLEQNARFISHGFMHGQLFLVDDYPGAVTMHTSARVYGDVYGNYDEMIFTALDEFEEIDQTDEYIRRSVSIFAQAEEMTCWTYLYNRPTQQLTHITSGDFLKYLDEKSGKKG